MAMLGTILLKHRTIAERELEQALIQQQRTGCRIGDILIGDGALRYYDLYQTLAEHHALPFADLLKEPPATELLANIPADVFIKQGLLPWKRTGGVTTVAVTDYSESIIAWCKNITGRMWRLPSPRRSIFAA